jgi:hypothetical protein
MGGGGFNPNVMGGGGFSIPEPASQSAGTDYDPYMNPFGE